ncbi:hypothetical protein BDV93DRAFT_524147 [Ceratobasidium sp. AG-I]|nr:hypothetical protein BDV93DRAFT_524147 [Ceratobasidium sp. AG-I]
MEKPIGSNSSGASAYTVALACSHLRDTNSDYDRNGSSSLARSTADGLGYGHSAQCCF